MVHPASAYLSLAKPARSNELVKDVNRSNVNGAGAVREIAPSPGRGSQLLLGALAVAALLLAQPGKSVASDTPMYRSALYEAPIGPGTPPGRYLPLPGYQAAAGTSPESTARDPGPFRPDTIADLLTALAMRKAIPDPAETPNPPPNTQTPSRHPETDWIRSGSQPVEGPGKPLDQIKNSNVLPIRI